MKKFLSAPAFLLCCHPAFSDTLYVNNDTAFPAEYRSFDDAFAAAADGDTIMLAPSQASYGTISITGKSIKLIGGGTSNKQPLLQPKRADIMDSIVDRIYVGQDSQDAPPTDEGAPDFSAADGTTISSIQTTQGVWLWSDDCVFTRCETASSLTIWGDRNIITGSIIRGGLYTYASVDMVIRSTGSLISNCLLTSGGGNIDSNTSATFTHCIIGFSETITAPEAPGFYSPLGSATFHHCIIAGSNNAVTGHRSDGTRLHYCLVAGTANSSMIPAHSSDNNNLSSTEPESIFESGFVLKEGSPAIGAGQDGVDLGIFGGPTPFQWGGLPALPLIEQFDILSANPTTGLRFRVKAVARD